MARNKLAFLLLLLMIFQPAFAKVELEDVTTVKEPFFRLGTTDIPENKIDVNGKIDIKPAVVKEEEKYYSEGLTYADLSIKKMALEVSKSIEVDYNEMM